LSRKWKFNKEWEAKVRAIVSSEFGKSEDWLRGIIRDEFQKIEAARGMALAGR